MAAACRDCRLTAAEARINRRALRALRRANRRKVFDKEVNKARVAAKMHVERMRLYVAGVAGVAAALALPVDVLVVASVAHAAHVCRDCAQDERQDDRD